MTNPQSKTPERGGQVGSVDAELVELEKRRNELLEGTEPSDEKAGETALQEPLSDEDAAERLSALDAVEGQIATGPAKGLEGVAVKLRVAVSLFEDARAGGEPDLPEWGCIKTAVETVERLATVNEAMDAEIVSLWHEYLVLDERGEAANEAEGEALFVQARERRDRILEIQARTTAGIAVKLKIAKESDEAEQAVLSALHDLERLSGPFVPATVATVDATSGRIPSIPVLHSTPAGHSTFVVEDACFAPLILEDDTVVIEPGQPRLVSGELYAIKREGKTQIWLAEEGGADMPGDSETEVWLFTLNDPFRWVGPCDRKEVKTIGRVVGVLDEDRPLVPEGDPVMVHEAEWQWLHRRSIKLALKRWRLEKDLPVRVQENTLFELSPDERPERYVEREPEAEKIGLSDIDRRSAAISARLVMVAGMIDGVPATTVAGAVAKLQNLWHYGHEGTSEEDRSSGEDRLLQGAIEVLGGEAVYMNWTEEEVRARYGHLEEGETDKRRAK